MTGEEFVIVNTTTIRVWPSPRAAGPLTFATQEAAESALNHALLSTTRHEYEAWPYAKFKLLAGDK